MSRFHRFDFPDLPIEAFKHVGDRRIKPQGGGGIPIVSDVFDAAGDVVEGAMDIVDSVVSPVADVVGDVAEGVVQTIDNTLQSAINDPIGTAATVATAIYAPYALPAVAAARALDSGMSPEDALLAAGTAYAAGQVGASAGQATGSGAIGAGAAGATSAALMGGDPLTGALAGGINYGVNTGLNQLVNAPTYSGGVPQGYTTTDAGDYTPGSGYDFKADYGLAPTQQNLGLQVDLTQVPTNLAYDTAAGLGSGLGLQYSTAPNLSSMGGGQGLTIDVPGGVVSQVGFIPADASPNLGDPNSFINNPDILGTPVAPVETVGSTVLPKVDAASILLGTGMPNFAGTYGQTGSATTTATDTAQGALPKELAPTLLQTAPVTEASDMSTMNLPQLFPSLAGVDPRLMQVLSGRVGTPSYYNYGQPVTAVSPLMASSISGMPSPGIPLRASGNAYSPLSSGVASGSPSSLVQSGLSLLGGGGGGGLSGYAHGGDVEGHNPQFITGKTGYYVRGEGDGQSDSIPAMLADGEYVFDADTVAALGNGSNEAGARILDKMRENLRKHKRSAKAGEIPPPAKSPLAYMKG